MKENGGQMDRLRQQAYDAMDRHAYGDARAAIEALGAYREAKEEAMELMVCLHIESGDPDAAAEALDALRAVQRPGPYQKFLDARIQFMRGNVLDALDLLQRISIKKTDPRYREKILNLMGQCYRFLGDNRRSVEAYLRASKAADSRPLAILEYSDYLFNLHYLPVSVEEQRKAAEAFNAFFDGCPQFLHRWRDPGETKIRIGYLSPDFRDHVVLRLVYALFSRYDRERFRVFLYANNAEDKYSRKLASLVEGWRNVMGMDPASVARVIYEDRIDILVDLAGHTRNNSLPAMAFRPAPVQISGIGYFASTGLAAMDYFLGDACMDDEGTQRGFTEELLVLPRSHFCYTPMRQISFDATPPFQKNGHITFGSFNNFSKVNDDVLRVWGRILQRVPGSRLLFKADIFQSPDSREHAYAMDRIRRAGIDLERVEARGLSREYLAEYRDMDIALDPFPYPGGGTTCDALYMGVPLISLRGPSHGERFGTSILQNIGLEALCAGSVDEYVERAVSLASDTELIATLHRNLRGMMQSSPLMDGNGYCSDMQAAYEMVWEAYLGSQAPLRYPEALRMLPKLDRLQTEGDMLQALAVADRILTAEPEDPSLLKRLSVLFLDAEDAVQSQKAVDLLARRGETGETAFLRAGIEALKQNWYEAVRLCRDALQSGRLDRDQQGAVHHLLANAWKHLGNRSEAAVEYLASSNCKEIETGKLVDYSNYLLNLHFVSRDRDALLKAAKDYGELFRPVPLPLDLAKHRREKLRIGYISPDFRQHVVACFSQAFFSAFDPNSFEVYGYALCEEDDVSRLLAAKATAWRNLRSMRAEEAARQIREDGIDILVDLSGHTGRNALPILAYRPAPLQICGIGYFDTTGSSAVDAFLVDCHTALPGEERFFTERILRLPESHLCFQPLPGMPSYVAPAPFREAGGITFGCLNQFDKVTDEVLCAWRDILERTGAGDEEPSRLLLKSSVFDNPLRKGKELARMERLGLPMDRVMLEGYTDRYLEAYLGIDIALDTWPYPGGGTTCDALYMGVPVISLADGSHHGRFGASLLANAGLEELCVASSIEEYVFKAVELAHSKELLEELHLTLRWRLQRTAAMNPGRYMAALEDAYRGIWMDWQRSHDPLFSTLQAERQREMEGVYAEKDWKRTACLAALSYRPGAPGNPALVAAFSFHSLGDASRTLFWAGKARAESPRNADAAYLEAWALQQLGRLPEALAACGNALGPGMEMDGFTCRNFRKLRAFAAFLAGSEDMSRFYWEAFEGEPPGTSQTDMYSSWLLTYNRREIDEALLFEKHLGYGKLFDGIRPISHRAAEHRHSDGKLRIGYLSPDFRVHVMYHFYLSLMACYNHDEFEVHAYSLVASPDSYTRSLEGLVDGWHDVSGLSPEDAARKIAEDGIDILFDLAGHTAGGGLPIMAWKPAPVQISGLGYMATTGLSAIDYFLTDSFVDPPGMNDSYFVEKLLRVRSQFCYMDISRRLPASAGAPCKDRGWALFGVFNAYRKYTDEMLVAWKEILDRVPGSKILLKSQVFFCPEMRLDAWQRIRRIGFDMGRVIFEPATTDYMERYLDVDISLDTYPYPGGGTTCDSLFMGAPVVSLCSSRHSTRFSYSILSNIGLPELATGSLRDYVDRAVALAQDTDLLDALHRNLRPMMRASAVMDTASYMEDIESCYRSIWSSYLKSHVE